MCFKNRVCWFWLWFWVFVFLFLWYGISLFCGLLELIIFLDLFLFIDWVWYVLEKFEGEVMRGKLEWMLFMLLLVMLVMFLLVLMIFWLKFVGRFELKFFIMVFWLSWLFVIIINRIFFNFLFEDFVSWVGIMVFIYCWDEFYKMLWCMCWEMDIISV